MACYHPVRGVQGGVNSNGKRPLLFSASVIDRHVKNGGLLTWVPCGRCVGCRLEYSKQWAMRCLDEAQMNRDNSFLTLTFSKDGFCRRESDVCKRCDVNHGEFELCKRDMQLFVKRVRKKLKKKVRFFGCGEYGELKGRPHYHLLLFGHAFSDRKFLKRTGSGFNIYMSQELQSCWDYGYTSVGDVTFESAAYVARYVMKKITGDKADEHYVDKKTGVIRTKEFTCMSRGGRTSKGNAGGIGSGWFERFYTDVFPFGTKVVNGVECKTPRYYDTLYERRDPEGYAKLKEKRKSLINVFENSLVRLIAKEEVTLENLKKFKRELEYV